MATKYDMPTNEGSLALARAVSTGAKLIIRGAALCNYTGSKMGSVSAVSNLTWNDLSGYALSSTLMPCTSYLPSMVDYQGVETNKPIAALDLEFTYMPTEEVNYNVVAVLADMYYAIMPFKLGNDYSVGDVVWVMDNSGNSSHYKCISSVHERSAPSYDNDHWEEVTLVSTLEGKYAGLEYSSISSQPILLYVSKVSGTITIGSQMELDYKVRLYLEGVQNTSSIKDFVVFNTLGLEIFASTELNLLAQFAEQLKRVRDIAMAKVSRS